MCIEVRVNVKNTDLNVLVQKTEQTSFLAGNISDRG